MKQSLQSVAGKLAFKLSLHRRLAADDFFIMAFHRVNDQSRDPLTCTTEAFTDYCRFFADHFEVVPLSEQIERLRNGGALSRTLSITFDDGYRDNYEIAAPIMERYGLTATIFIVSGFIGTDAVAWWDREAGAPMPWMTWDQVRALREHAFDIGCHTHTHADLGSIDAPAAHEELTTSRRILNRELQAPIDLFAYPYGGKQNITEEARAMVRAEGFRCCLSCHGGVNGVRDDPYHLTRIPVSSWYRSPYHLGADMLARRT